MKVIITTKNFSASDNPSGRKNAKKEKPCYEIDAPVRPALDHRADAPYGVRGEEGHLPKGIQRLLAKARFFWVCSKKFAMDKISKRQKTRIGEGFYNWGKYVFCGVTVLVYILSIMYGGIG